MASSPSCATISAASPKPPSAWRRWPPNLPAAITRWKRTLKQVYEDFVGTFAGILENHPKVRDPRAAAIAFVGSVQGIAIQGLLRENEHTIDELANAFLTMFAEW